MGGTVGTDPIVCGWQGINGSTELTLSRNVTQAGTIIVHCTQHRFVMFAGVRKCLFDADELNHVQCVEIFVPIVMCM